MRRIIIGLFLCVVFSGFAAAQDQVWVFFTDKKGSTFNPYSYFNSKAIERRLKHGINLYDSTDYPVSAPYINQVKACGFEVKVISRWLNCAVGTGTEKALQKIEQLPFVKSVEHQTVDKQIASVPEGVSEIPLITAQVERMDRGTFAQNDVNGKGVRIAVFDIGFTGLYDNHVFRHLRDSNRIYKTWDFVKNRAELEGNHNHGTAVLSCIAGKFNEQNIGLATQADFLLARTETWTERKSEEANWLAAAEWADKNGADIINSSLGYTNKRYFREDMDGTKTFVTRAAAMAVRKGILVVNAAGNEGSGNWHNIAAPADADSVLTVGGIKPSTGIHTSFSSYGPNWRKVLKPNVCAYGHVKAAHGKSGVSSTQGTSFSSPLVAGFAACVMQLYPEKTNMQIFDMIQKSGDLFPYFDYAHGYGVPQSEYFKEAIKNYKEAPLQIDLNQGYSSDVQRESFQIIDSADYIIFELEPAKSKARTDSAGHYLSWPNYLLYHIEISKGYVLQYKVTNPYETVNGLGKTEGPARVFFWKNEVKAPYTIRAYWQGQVQEWEVIK